MPTASPVPSIPAASAPSPNGDVRAAIARASRQTGVDFDYLLAQARLEFLGVQALALEPVVPLP